MNLTRVATIELNERKASSDGLRTFPVTLSTETPVPRRDMFGERFDEILSHAPGAVDLSRAPVPVIESHESRKVNVGIVTNLRLENKKLRGDLVLGKSARAKELADDIDAGIVSNVSVGYAINAIPDEGDVRTATRWTLYELSIVSVPADVNAGINRSAATNNQTRSNDVKNRKLQAPDDGNGSGGGDVAQKERERVEGIKHSIRTAKLEESIGADLIRSGVSLDQARSQVIDILAARSDALLGGDHGIGGGYRGTVTGGETSNERFIRGASAWLFEKAGSGIVQRAVDAKVRGFEKIDLDGGEFRGMSLVDLARESLERSGVRTRGMGRQQLVGTALTHLSGRAGVSDFAILFENVMNKTLQAAYATAPDSWRKFCKVELVSDFRDSHRFRAGTFGPLDIVAEHAEFQNKSIPDGSKLSINTQTKGNLITLSRQAIINDDMGALGDLAARFGRAAMLSIEVDVFALLAENAGLGPTQTDAQPFFHSNRANVATTSVLGVAGLDVDRQVLAAQKDNDDNEFLDLEPYALLVPIGLGSQAKILNTSAFDHDSTHLQKPNAVQGIVREVVQSSRISGTRRYLFANPAVAPALVVAFLQESGQGPYLEQQQGWRVDGTEWKVRIDAKAQMHDPKGAVTSAGTA